MGNLAGDIGTDAATGATLGSFIPGVGTAIGAGAGALFGLGKGIYDIYQGNKSQDAAQAKLDELAKTPYPKFQITPEFQKSYNQADALSNQGFSGEERANFFGNLAQSNTANYRNAIARGGGSLAQAIQGGINSNNVGALNTFASNDANLHRSNMRYASSLSQILQNHQDMQTNADMQRRQMLERAYGGAIAQGKQNISQGLGDMSNAGFYAAGTLLGARNGRTKPTPNYGEPPVGTTIGADQHYAPGYAPLGIE